MPMTPKPQKTQEAISAPDKSDQLDDYDGQRNPQYALSRYFRRNYLV